MHVLRTTYDYYVSEMRKAKERMKNDRLIIKMVSKLINTKQITPGEETKLNKLLTKGD